MATTASGDFENALRRLEEIVAKLDGESVSLDESVALFREGRQLAEKCELLLRNAQTSIEAASREPGDAAKLAPAHGGSNVAGQPASAARSTRNAAPLFGEPIVDDADPDL